MLIKFIRLHLPTFTQYEDNPVNQMVKLVLKLLTEYPETGLNVLLGSLKLNMEAGDPHALPMLELIDKIVTSYRSSKYDPRVDIRCYKNVEVQHRIEANFSKYTPQQMVVMRNNALRKL